MAMFLKTQRVLFSLGFLLVLVSVAHALPSWCQSDDQLEEDEESTSAASIGTLPVLTAILNFWRSIFTCLANWYFENYLGCNFEVYDLCY